MYLINPLSAYTPDNSLPTLAVTFTTTQQLWYNDESYPCATHTLVLLSISEKYVF